MGKECIGKTSGKIIINEPISIVLENIKAPFEITRENLKSWQVNQYVSYRPDNNCQVQAWDKFLLNDSNPYSIWTFNKQYDVTECTTQTATYRISNQFGQSDGNIFFAIIPNGFSFVPWKCQIKVIDGDGNQVFFKDYDYGKCPSIKVNCAGCPSGQIELKTNQYPGYCCLSCSEIKSEIKNMASSLKGIKLNG
ncbi:hypothetical protein [Calothrix sp. 336/3]|uniref:hypothetical protein n=1 Tax=Calothrix sp. 336/3 TaxID=1337936 RepID=UPI0004E3F2A1|nr:hypothetical protein [Calothrix sp. 336/3]AKG21489.1 hypothetical protein IJ00_09530 [Calothrix sp. 336/3]